MGIRFAIVGPVKLMAEIREDAEKRALRELHTRAAVSIALLDKALERSQLHKCGTDTSHHRSHVEHATMPDGFVYGRSSGKRVLVPDDNGEGKWAELEFYGGCEIIGVS